MEYRQWLMGCRKVKIGVVDHFGLKTIAFYKNQAYNEIRPKWSS